MVIYSNILTNLLIIIVFLTIKLLLSYIIYLFFFFLNTVFAYGETFVSLLLARSLQGTASALISVSGITCY